MPKPPKPPVSNTLIKPIPLVININFLVLRDTLYFVDTREYSVVATLPDKPEIGDRVYLNDYAGSFSINNCIIMSKDNIMRQSGNIRIASENASIILIYVDVFLGWMYINQSGWNFPVIIEQPLFNEDGTPWLNEDGTPALREG